MVQGKNVKSKVFKTATKSFLNYNIDEETQAASVRKENTARISD